jgi:polysaccharide pyruvyl transferase WcaK-like protein
MKSAARAAHYRSYRDTLSKKFLESIGLDTQDDPVYPDIAFNLPAPSVPRRRAASGDPLAVGVGVMTYRGWRNDPSRGATIYTTYLEKITGFVLWLLERGHVVRILMGEDSDRHAVDDLFEALRKKKPDLAKGSVVFAPAHTLHDIMQQMAAVDVVVATRYHNVVCALRMRKPTISIGYAAKNDALLTEMGLTGFCQHIEHLDVQRLKKQITRLMSDRAHFRRQIGAANTRFERKLREQETRLALLIRSPSC